MAKLFKKPKSEDPRVQKTVMIEGVVDRIIEAESKNTNMSFSSVLNNALRRAYKLS